MNFQKQQPERCRVSNSRSHPFWCFPCWFQYYFFFEYNLWFCPLHRNIFFFLLLLKIITIKSFHFTLFPFNFEIYVLHLLLTNWNKRQPWVKFTHTNINMNDALKPIHTKFQLANSHGFEHRIVQILDIIIISVMLLWVKCESVCVCMCVRVFMCVCNAIDYKPIAMSSVCSVWDCICVLQCQEIQKWNNI